MLTSKAAGILASVDTVIIDEIHALAGTKRGVHLALTLERLAAVAGEFQRIGLSATVRPLSAVSNFLGGDRPVDIVAPPALKRWQLDVHVPVEDMSDLPTPEQGSTIGEMTVDDPLGITGTFDGASPAGFGLRLAHGQVHLALHRGGPLPEIMEHRSTLVFVNSRRTAERLTSRLNELYAQEHDPESLSPTTRRDPAQLMKQVDVVRHSACRYRPCTPWIGVQGRAPAYGDDAQGRLPACCGGHELVGARYRHGRGGAGGASRITSFSGFWPAARGRAGHSVGAVSQGSFYPKHRADLVQSTLTVSRMREGLIEEMHSPRNPLDVLAQQTVAAVAAAEVAPVTVRGVQPGAEGFGEADSVGGLDADTWYSMVRRAWPYRDLAREVFDSVIDLVSGVYPRLTFLSSNPAWSMTASRGC